MSMEFTYAEQPSRMLAEITPTGEIAIHCTEQELVDLLEKETRPNLMFCERLILEIVRLRAQIDQQKP